MQFVKTLNPDFVCKVCKDPWDPEAVTQCEACQSTFCKACYDEAMMKDAKCHSCEKQPATFKNVHMLVRSMASNLKVFCRYKSHGCSWEGVRTAFESHVASCPHRPKEFSYLDESSIPPELMCPICNMPFSDPVQLACEHVFCRPCITEALKRNSSCPVDRSDVSVDSLTVPPKLILEILDELPVRCAHHDATVSPCAWTGRRRDYIGHRAMCKGGMPVVINTVAPSQPSPVSPHSPAPSSSTPMVGPSGSTDSSSKKMTLQPIGEFKTLEKVAGSSAPKSFYAVAHLKAPTLDSLDQRKKPLSLSAVIDISGSMAGSKLKMAQDSLNFMIDELTERDELGIIAFHTDVELTFRLGKMNEVGKSAARSAVAKLTAKNCTNLSGGLFAGLSQVEKKLFDKEDFDNYYADGGLRKKNTHHHHGMMVHHHNYKKHHHYHAHHHPHHHLVHPSAVSTPYQQPVQQALLSVEDVKKGDMTLSYYTCSLSRNGGSAVYTAGLEITLNAAVIPVLQSGQFMISIRPQGQPQSLLSPNSLRQGQTYKYSWETSMKMQHIDVQFETSSAPAAHSSSIFHHHTIDLTTEEAEFNTEKYDFLKVAERMEAEHSLTKENKIDRCRAVLLFTDGVANGGVTSESGLERILRQRLNVSSDIVVHTFGFGADHNARMLQGVASIASGSYYFIQDVASMKESFADCLGGLLSTVAQNIELTVKCPLESEIIQIQEIHSSFPVKDVGLDSKSKIVTLRDVYSTEVRDILVQLSYHGDRLPMVDSEQSLSILQFSLRYDSLLTGEVETDQAEVVVKVTNVRPMDETPHPKIDEQRARIELTRALAEAQAAADHGDLYAGRERLLATKEAMKVQHNHTPYFSAILDDMAEVEQQMATPQMWADGGSKQCAAVTSCHVQQRMNRGGNVSEAQSAAMGYDNSWKAAMRKKSKN